MLFLPEFRLKKIVDALLEYLVKDLKDNIVRGVEQESFLYLLFHVDSNDSFQSDYYKQAKEIFLRDSKNPRKISTYPIYNKSKANMPSIHIVVPQESDELRQVGDIEGEEYEDLFIERVGRGFSSQFGIVCTSENIMEVMLIIYVLRGLFLGSMNHLSLVGFINPILVTQDMSVRQDLVPDNCFIKGLAIHAQYQEIVPEVGYKKNGVTKVVFDIEKIIY